MIKGTVLPLLYAGLAAFVGLCALLYLVQERLIFIRQPLADSARHALRALPDTVELEVAAEDGTRLHGWLRHGVENGEDVEKAASRGLVLYFGGNAEEVSGQMFDAARLAPWSAAAVNYRGYGLSEGRPGETALVADALAVYDRLRARGDVDPERIVVFGRSLGSGVAVQLAARAGRYARSYSSPPSTACEARPEAVPVSPRLAAPQASLRFAGARAADRSAAAGARGRPRYARSRGPLAAPARRLGRPKRWTLIPKRTTTTSRPNPPTGPRYAGSWRPSHPPRRENGAEPACRLRGGERPGFT